VPSAILHDRDSHRREAQPRRPACSPDGESGGVLSIWPCEDVRRVGMERDAGVLSAVCLVAALLGLTVTSMRLSKSAGASEG